MLRADLAGNGYERIVIHTGSALGVLMEDSNGNLVSTANFQGSLPDIYQVWDWTFVADDRLATIDLDGYGVQSLMITRGGQDSFTRARDEIAVLFEFWPGILAFEYHKWGTDI